MIGNVHVGTGIIATREDLVMQDVGKLFEMAMELSREERIELADRILARSQADADPDADTAWIAEARRRLDEARRGEVSMMPWPQTRKAIMGQANADARD